MKKSYVNPSTQQIIQLPNLIHDMIECILIRLIAHISLNELSILRCCLPNFLYQLFQQIPNLLIENVVEWIVEGIRNQSNVSLS
ncbi:hypothetical protein I4U23_000496 [Adineta vaga]|nr:hypothetical protein I4U23_000496 [Adineta vaga]